MQFLNLIPIESRLLVSEAIYSLRASNRRRIIAVRLDPVDLDRLHALFSQVRYQLIPLKLGLKF